MHLRCGQSLSFCSLAALLHTLVQGVPVELSLFHLALKPAKRFSAWKEPLV